MVYVNLSNRVPSPFCAVDTDWMNRLHIVVVKVGFGLGAALSHWSADVLMFFEILPIFEAALRLPSRARLPPSNWYLGEARPSLTINISSQVNLWMLAEDVGCWSHLATEGHTWQQLFTPGNSWSELETAGHTWNSWSHLAHK